MRISQLIARVEDRVIERAPQAKAKARSLVGSGLRSFGLAMQRIGNTCEDKGTAVLYPEPARNATFDAPVTNE